MNTIFLMGDSTCQTNDETTFPQVGWGQFLQEYINCSYKVVNLAKNGRSSKSFIDEGLYKPCLESIKKGDFLFIQFGHNDEKNDPSRATSPFTTYLDNLHFLISIAKNAGATPVLLSSIYRRHFINGKIVDNCHLDYPQAMEELSKKENVIYIDMCSLTKDYLQSIGEEASKELFMNFPSSTYPLYPKGKEDNTHLREKGARVVLSLLISSIKQYKELSIIL